MTGLPRMLTLFAKTQRFDAGKASPLLSHLLGGEQLDVKGKRALVPGCG
jgi:hypothetical protein